MLVLEVGFKLDKDLNYYDKVLREHGLINVFNCTTHDIYYANENLDGLTENEMKQKCIRLRNVNNDTIYKIQNCPFENYSNNIHKNELVDFEKYLLDRGYKKTFDTIKNDHHYSKDGMNSRVQLQEIDNVGLLVYFDNKDYYELQFDEQRRKLIDELNSYGFNFNYETLGLDKLRTLYYKKEMFSSNQNG